MLLQAAGIPLDYELLMGLYYNVPRIQAQHEAAVGNGVSLGMGDGDVDFTVADAIARCPEAAWRIQHEMNVARDAARRRKR